MILFVFVFAVTLLFWAGASYLSDRAAAWLHKRHYAKTHFSNTERYRDGI